MFILQGFAQTVVITNPTNPWTVPAGVTSIKVEVWGGGGGGGGCNSALGTSYGSGGGGGAYNVSTFPVSNGQTYTILIGAGGTGSSDANGKDGTASSVSGPGGSVSANPGSGGARRGGLAGTGATGGFNNGGNGGRANSNGAGGGGGAGNAPPSGTGNGGDGSNTAAGSAGAGALPGGAGGAYRNSNGTGKAGEAPGGGGGGGYQIFFNGRKAGGTGASGQVVITYTTETGTTITGFSPVSACSASGQSVIISGTNFTGATAVTFYSGQPALFTVNSATQITANLPAGATTGPISVATPLGTGTSSSSFTVDAISAAPDVGTITNLTCTVATGSVVLNGLPTTGTWTLIRNPGDITTSGTGTSTTVTGLVAGTYNFTVTSAQGCISPPSADVVITPQPSSPTPPVVGAITQPTCAISTGGVALSGLPSTGNWTLTRTPGGVTVSGSGSTTTVSTLPSGTYTFAVTNSTGCVSSPSGSVLINAQPSIPPAPTVGTITPPSCTLATGIVLLSGLPATGTWTLIRYPGTISTTGTGTSTTLSGLPTGTYNYTVTTVDGCLSVPSANVVLPAQPPTPAAPVVGTITQPTLAVPSGSVLLSGLPSPGAWIITLLPGALKTPGSGTSETIANLEGGVFIFTVTNSSGCTSLESTQVVISTPNVPVLVITDPSPVCSPSTVDITSSLISAGSTPGLTFSYWTDLQATIPYSTPTSATVGTYFIKGTTASGYFDIKPVVVTIGTLPVPNAGADQTLGYQFSTTLDAILSPNETGIWSLLSGTGKFSNSSDPKSSISDLSMGENLLLWSVKTAVCPEVYDTVKIFVENLIIPTLITPNMDGRNDYFVINGLTTLGKTEVYIFDRRGVQVYKNLDYHNSWDGVDYNKNPLPDDTYFYVIKTANGKSLSGYVVIRR